MKLYKYEFYKLSGNKFLIIFCALLLLLNVFFCASHVIDRRDEQTIPDGELEQFIKLYQQDPEGINTYFAELEQIQAEYNEEFDKFLATHHKPSDIMNYPPLELPKVYSDGKEYSDLDLMNAMLALDSYADTVTAQRAQIISNARRNQKEILRQGGTEKDYMYVYQVKAMEIYQRLDNSPERLQGGIVKGWDDLLSYNTSSVFMMLAIIVLGSAMYTSERSGMTALARCSARGRVSLAAAKGIASAIASVAVALAFVATDVLTVAFTEGYSSGGISATMISGLERVYFDCSVIELYMLRVAGFAVTAVVICIMLTAISSCMNSVLPCYLSGLVFVGVNLLMSEFKYRSNINPLKYLNLFVSSNLQKLFSLYNCTPVFGLCVPTLHLLVIMLCLIVVLSVTFLLLFAHFGRSSGQTWAFGARLLAKFVKIIDGFKAKRRDSVQKTRLASLSIFGAELTKTLKATMLIVIVAILAAKVFCAATVQYEPPQNVYDNFFRLYMEKLEGEWSDQKHQTLLDDKESILQELDKQDQVEQQYLDGKLSFNEYLAYMESRDALRQKLEYVEMIIDHSNYLVEQSELRGEPAYYLYDTGWKTLIVAGADLFLYAVIFLVSTGVFAMEYDVKGSSSGFSNILRTTRFGRQTTFRSKLGVAVLSTLVACLVFSFSDMLIIHLNIGFAVPSAPIWCSRMFAEYSGGMNYAQLLLLILAIRLCACFVIALLGLGTSCLMRRRISSMAVISALTLIPFLLDAVGLVLPACVDFTKILSGGELLRSGDSVLNVTAAAVTVCAWVVIATAVVFAARTKWVARTTK